MSRVNFTTRCPTRGWSFTLYSFNEFGHYNFLVKSITRQPHFLVMGWFSQNRLLTILKHSQQYFSSKWGTMSNSRDVVSLQLIERGSVCRSPAGWGPRDKNVWHDTTMKTSDLPETTVYTVKHGIKGREVSLVPRLMYLWRSDVSSQSDTTILKCGPKLFGTCKSTAN